MAVSHAIEDDYGLGLFVFTRDFGSIILAEAFIVNLCWISGGCKLHMCCALRLCKKCIRVRGAGGFNSIT